MKETRTRTRKRSNFFSILFLFYFYIFFILHTMVPQALICYGLINFKHEWTYIRIYIHTYISSYLTLHRGKWAQGIVCCAYWVSC
ncbi:uncharacterized protein GGS25DRAFT_199799 [Hypoxylon fragiforme]|uniref:uncharacterized protein n=1 Tax=Hypoxylon fragiforme TaxID=63214 RepID=UPI0020C6DA17|nr:uncharacterized protein GGS25DRAFT_199799 [Hypoxylon fragiforme]KAI2611524.1 hypothetical protein GGS25DRAFT_199799 [Hypoxylon fragiforme]